jgi:hypothetical protein
MRIVKVGMKRFIPVASWTVVLSIALCGHAAPQESGAAGAKEKTDLDDGLKKQPIVLIASGLLVSTDASFPGSCSYRLMDVWYGRSSTNVVSVWFNRNTVPGEGCPTNAILILQKGEGSATNFLFALGDDASLGILPYSVDKWNEIKSRTPAELSQTRPEDRISRDKALDIALKAVAKEGRPRSDETLKCDAIRYNFGWDVYVTFVQRDGKMIIGGDVVIRIGDDGKLKDYQHGL